MRRLTIVEDSGMALTWWVKLTRKSKGGIWSSDLGPGPELFLYLSCPSAPAARPLEFSVRIM